MQFGVGRKDSGVTMPASISGLADEEARRRLAVDGPNELPTTGRRRPWRIALEILREPMFGLLLAGGVIYAALGDLLGGAVLLVFASLSVSISIVQEIRSERVLDALPCDVLVVKPAHFASRVEHRSRGMRVVPPQPLMPMPL